MTALQRVSAAARDTSLMLDATYPASLCAEAVDRRRLDKLSEEVGEVIEAYGVCVGENPRKGITHDREQVLDELLDVAACSLGAWEHLSGHTGGSGHALLELIERKRDRLAAAIRAAS